MRVVVARAWCAWCVVLACSVLAPRRALAATFTVTTTVDTSASSPGALPLRAAFKQASSNATSDTIVLQPGATYNLDCNQGPVKQTDTLKITVQGNGATIHMLCDTESVLYTRNVRLEDTKVTGGNIGVESHGGLELDGSSISEVHGFGFGISGPVSLIANSEIVDNDGYGVDGGSNGMLILSSTIARNGRDGVFSVDVSPWYVLSSEILDNGEQGLRGTGQAHTRMYIWNSTVGGNGQNGVCCTGCRSMNVSGSFIEDNGVAALNDFNPQVPDPCRSGGGIGLLLQGSNYSDVGLFIDGSVISGNRAFHPGGGAIATTIADQVYHLGARVVIDDTTFSNNVTIGTLAADGGGLAALVGDLSVTNSTFESNAASTSAEGVPGGFGRGGGLTYAPRNSSPEFSAFISAVSFQSNTAPAGAGFHAALSTSSLVDVQHVQALDNVATGSGGGALLCIPHGSISDSTFDGNSAGTGGGLFSCGPKNADLAIDRSTFSDNLASSLGGGLAVNDSNVTLMNSTLTHNQARSAAASASAWAASAGPRK